MLELTNDPAGRVQLAKALKSLSAKKEGGKMWLFEVEEHLKQNNMKLGEYFFESGRDKTCRRIKLQLTKCNGDLVLSFMSKHSKTEDEAGKIIADIMPWAAMKNIDTLPDLGGDIDTILGEM